MKTLLCLLVFINILLLVRGLSAKTKRNKLLYILLDGFRYDYTDDQPAENIPGFTKFLKEGVRAKYSSPIYPAISYPGWTSLVTGLWAESHGIVGNYFYDSATKENFSLFDADSTGKEKWWANAEPIWSTATKSNLRTAVILLSRCDIPFDGVVPEYCEPFIMIRGPEIFRTNAEKALDKLEEGFDFVLLYNEYMDNVGHTIGPETDERRKAIREMDDTMVYMLDRIEQMGLTDQVNIVITSDHGMAPTAPGEITRIELDDYLSADDVENIADSRVFSNIKVKPGRVQQVYEKLKEMPGVDVYLHDDIPEELHYKNNKYIHDIILKPNTSTFIMPSKTHVQLPPRSSYVYNGAHGFDPMDEKMRTIFFAKGPDFNNDLIIPPVRNVDIYPLLAHLLKVTPRANNGTTTIISQALSDSPARPTALDYEPVITASADTSSSHILLTLGLTTLLSFIVG